VKRAAEACLSKQFPARLAGSRLHGSGDQLFDHFAVDIGKPHVASCVKIGQQGVIQSHQIQGRGVEIVNDVEPVSGPWFTVLRTGQQIFNYLRVSVGRLVVEKRLLLLR
jgi:hypothetical protein